MLKQLSHWSCLFIVFFAFQVQANDHVVSKKEIQQAEQLAEAAYVFAYPMMQNYKSLYFRTVVGKKPLNNLSHRRKLLGPKFTAIVGPNNDTLYSAGWLDLANEPFVISVPNVDNNRYYSIQLIDMFTHNFAYIGQRTTGDKVGSYLIVGPEQKIDSVPDGIDGVYQSESNFVFVIGRMLAKGGKDEALAANLLQQYQLQSLDQFKGKSVEFKKSQVAFPPYDVDQVKNHHFIDLFNFLLQFVAIHPSERIMLDSFENIGVIAGKPSSFEGFPVEIQQAIKKGVSTAFNKIAAESKLIGSQVAGWNTTYLGFGSRDVMQGKYLLRAAAAMIALYGNDREENSSFSRQVDQDRQPLNGALNDNSTAYTLRFEKGHFPQSNAFWSLTMYRLPEVLLYENDIQRYSISDRNQALQYGADGSLTFYIQHQAPQADKLNNWLPAPAGPFALALRTYLPKPSVYNGKWQPPEVKRTH